MYIRYIQSVCYFEKSCEKVGSGFWLSSFSLSFVGRRTNMYYINTMYGFNISLALAQLVNYLFLIPVYPTSTIRQDIRSEKCCHPSVVLLQMLQISKILNAHMESLQWIDRSAGILLFS